MSELKNRIYIELFGSPQIVLDGIPINIPRKRVRAMLYYLAERHAPVSRSTVADILWPDMDAVSASQNMSTHISYLKKALGNHVVEAFSDQITLNPLVDSDVNRFRQLTALGSVEALMEALSLFKGNFLDGFALRGAQAYEAWIRDCDAYWNRCFIDTSLSAAKLLEERGEHSTALHVLDKAAKLDPTREDLCRLRMHICHMSGDRSSVIRIYQELLTSLSDELGVPPAAETAECYSRIVFHESTAPAEQPPARPGMGRNQKMKFVGRRALLEAMKPERANHFVLLQGKSGFGKSRLMNEYIRRSGQTGIQISFKQQEQDMPYFGIIKCIRNLLHTDKNGALKNRLEQQLNPHFRDVLCRMVPDFLMNQQEKHFFVLEAKDIVETFEQTFLLITANEPSVIAIDDIHFADQSSLKILRYLTEQQSLSHIQFIATFRPSLSRPEVIAFFNALQRESLIDILDIGKMKDSEIRELLLHYYPDIDPENADKLINLADGNPYWMKIIMNGFDSGYNVFSGNASLANLFSRSLRFLSPQALDMVYMLAILGDTCDGDLFRSLCAEIGCDNTDSIYEELFATDMISMDYLGSINFSHSKIYEYVLSIIAEKPKQVKSLQYLIAHALEELYGDDALGPHTISLADHYSQSNRPELCAKHAVNAGMYLLSMDDGENAIKYYKLALSYLEAPESFDVTIMLCDEMFELNKGYEAKIFLGTAAENAAALGRREYELFFRAFFMIGNLPEFAEVRQGIFPCYFLDRDDSLLEMLRDGKDIAEADRQNRFLTNYICSFTSTYYRIIGDFEMSKHYAWQIVNANALWRSKNDMVTNVLVFSAMRDIVTMMNQDADIDIRQAICLGDNLFQEFQINTMSYSNMGMKAVLRNIEGNLDDGRKIMDSTILAVRKTNNRIALADCLVTQAMLIHNDYPQKSYSMNFEAYHIAKELNLRYTFVKALTGLVITSPSLPEAQTYYQELCHFAESLSGGSILKKISSAKKALEQKWEVPQK